MSASSDHPKKRQSCLGNCGCWVLGMVILVMLAGIALGPIGGQPHYRENMTVQTARQIGMTMLAYANDNDGKYPDGKSSTEVFQKLLDGGYINDPSIFYIPLSGKTEALLEQKIILKPENVSFDVTSGADAHSPDQLPLVFTTGYKVTYAPGAAAVPLIKPYPNYWEVSWFNWSGRDSFRPGIVVFYKNNNAMYKPLNPPGTSDNIVPNFVPPDFKPDGKTYRQLTPDGTLPEK